MNTKGEALLEAGGIRVRFAWLGDRYAHEILLREPFGWRAVLASVEGSPEDDWPASPPFQSLEIEPRGGQPVALLVGMAGKSHWSASVSIVPDSPCVHFDVAVRVRASEVGPLGSAYRAMDVSQAQLELPNECAGISIVREPGNVRVSVAAPHAAAARTIRWAYRVRLAPGSG
ncbi:MAG TPA: hypothetical protein VFW87_19860 [Pirellulales bacterium]|nr:hypothetical protein [Pirellulales bacterium]